MWGRSVNTDRGERKISEVRDEGQRHEAAAPRSRGNRRPGTHGFGRGAGQCRAGRRRRASRGGQGGGLRPRRRRRRSRCAAPRRRSAGPAAPLGRRRPPLRQRRQGGGPTAARGPRAGDRRPDQGRQERLLQGLGPGGDDQAASPRRPADQAGQVGVRGLERHGQRGQRHRLRRRFRPRRPRRGRHAGPGRPAQQPALDPARRRTDPQRAEDREDPERQGQPGHRDRQRPPPGPRRPPRQGRRDRLPVGVPGQRQGGGPGPEGRVHHQRQRHQ